MTDGLTDPEDASAAALNIAGNCNFSFLHSPVNSAIRIPGHSPAQDGRQTGVGAGRNCNAMQDSEKDVSWSVSGCVMMRTEMIIIILKE